MWEIHITQEHYETWPDEEGLRQYLPGIKSATLAKRGYACNVGDKLRDLVAFDVMAGKYYRVQEAICSALTENGCTVLDVIGPFEEIEAA